MYRYRLIKLLQQDSHLTAFGLSRNNSFLRSSLPLRGFCSSFHPAGGGYSDGIDIESKEERHSHNTSNVLSTKNLTQDVSNNRQPIPHQFLSNKPFTLVHPPLEDPVLQHTEPELRDDIFEDTVNNAFGEEVSIAKVSTSDSVEPLLPSEQKAAQIKFLHRELRTASSYEVVFDIFDTKKSEFYIEHYDSAVRVLTDFIIKGAVSSSTLQRDPQFLKLARDLCKVCRRYDAYELITLLKFVAILGTPPSSTFYVTVLQMVRHQINDFSLRQLLYIHQLLSRSSGNDKLVSALKMAAEVLTELKLKDEDVPEDLAINDIIAGLAMSTESKKPVVANKFLMALFESEKGLKEASNFSLVSAIVALVDLQKVWRSSFRRASLKVSQEVRVTREVLLKEGLLLASQKMSVLPIKTVLKVLRELSFGYSEGDSSTHHQVFLDQCAKKVIEENVPIGTLAGTVFLMQKMNRVHDGLMEHVATKIESTPSEALNRERFFALALINQLPCSTPGHTWGPEKLHPIIEKLLAHDSLSDDTHHTRGHPVCRVGSDLASLNYFKPTVISKIFDHIAQRLKSVLPLCNDSSPDVSSLKGMEKVEFLQFLQFYQALTLLNKDQPVPEVPGDLLRVCHEVVVGNAREAAERERSLVGALLEDAMGGEDCLVTGVYTPNYIPLDHALVVREDGQLVSQSGKSGPICTSDLNKTANSKILGIVEVDYGCLLNGGERPRSRHLVRMRVLAADGVVPVPLFLPQLGAHESDKEKYQYVTAALHQHGVFLAN